MIHYILEHISSWEKKKQTEHQIVNNCLLLIRKVDYARDFIFDVNDALHQKGYSYQFLTPTKYNFIVDRRFFELTTQTSKSLNKTKDLLIYLTKLCDFRVSFAALHCLRVQNLIMLGLLPETPFFLSCKKENLLNAYFSNYFKDLEAQKSIEELFDPLGIRYLSLPSFRFKMDMEYLLWTMNKKDHSKSLFLKQNTIRVAFSITPSVIYETGDKIYYDENISLHLVTYLKLIDKNAIKHMKDKYNDILESLNIETGYKILFYTL